MKKHLVACMTLGLSFQAQATFIDYGSYLSDAGTGLDWLDVTASVNRSYNDVSTQFGMGGDFEGYRYATLTEWKTLIYGNTGISVTSNGPAYQAVEDGRVDALVAALGSTLDTLYLNSWWGVTFDNIKGYAEGERYDYTLGMLGEIVSGVFPSDVVRMAIIDDYDSYSNPLTIIIEPTTNPPDFVKSSFLNDWMKPDTRRYNMGSYLVRDTASISIPEPSTIALLALGLAGLSFNRKRSKNQNQKS